MNPTDFTLLTKQLSALIEGEENWIANLANASALLFDALDNINWAGFYSSDGDTLVLGPFQGKPACVRIPWDKGVCGTAAATEETLRIADVHQFDGHIACDAASNSEIVIPLISRKNGESQVIGVLDIDSPIHDRFSEEDQKGLEAFVDALMAHYDSI